MQKPHQPHAGFNLHVLILEVLKYNPYREVLRKNYSEFSCLHETPDTPFDALFVSLNAIA